MENGSYFLGIRSVLSSYFCPNGHSGLLEPGPHSAFNALELRISFELRLALRPCRHWRKKHWEILSLLSSVPVREMRTQ